MNSQNPDFSATIGALWDDEDFTAIRHNMVMSMKKRHCCFCDALGHEIKQCPLFKDANKQAKQFPSLAVKWGKAKFAKKGKTKAEQIELAVNKREGKAARKRQEMEVARANYVAMEQKAGVAEELNKRLEDVQAQMQGLQHQQQH